MQLLHGRYEIVEIIKSGGMGSVYEAKDTKLADSPCAVKEILEDKQNVLYFQTRFEQEMKVLAELDHPAIPRVRDFFRLKGKHYLVMDLVRGQSLFDEVECQGGPLAPEQVAKDMLELLDVLDYLHSHNPPIIHRDIKPSNILRDRRSRQIKLVDFGLARSACGATQTAVGTLGYCAPEQSVGRAEPRSDLYSVGATMIGLLTGQDPDMINPKQQLQSLPAGLRQVIQRATRLKAQERYTSAREMATDLRLWQRGLGAAAGRVAEPETAPPEVVYVHAQSSPWRGYATAAAIVLALGLGTWLGRSEVPPSPEPSSVPARPIAEEAVAQPQTGPPPIAQAPPPTAYVPAPAPRPEVQEAIPSPAPAPVAAVVPQSRPRPPVEIHPSLGRPSYPTYSPEHNSDRLLERRPFFQDQPGLLPHSRPEPPFDPILSVQERRRRLFNP
ncbi:serine/threonine protein kinase [bacterium]|nr:serine/threonine protein kinase [bacterium]